MSSYPASPTRALDSPGDAGRFSLSPMADSRRSQSSKSTFFPSSAMESARFIVLVLFPSPFDTLVTPISLPLFSSAGSENMTFVLRVLYASVTANDAFFPTKMNSSSPAALFFSPLSRDFFLKNAFTINNSFIKTSY